MSSIYPLGMSWPGEAGFSMDTTTTATLVIGGCVGEAVVPLIIGACIHAMHRLILCRLALGWSSRICCTQPNKQTSTNFNQTTGGVMHWLGPAILPLAILSVVGVLTVTLGTIKGLGRAALNHRLIADKDAVIGIEDSGSSVKMAEERQSRAPTAAGLGGEEEEEDLEADGAAVRMRVSFVLDKALDESVGLGAAAAAVAAKSYHHRLSLSDGTAGFALARASAVFAEGGKSPPKRAAIGGHASVVQTTYGT